MFGAPKALPQSGGWDVNWEDCRSVYASSVDSLGSLKKMAGYSFLQKENNSTSLPYRLIIRLVNY